MFRALVEMKLLQIIARTPVGHVIAALEIVLYRMPVIHHVGNAGAIGVVDVQCSLAGIRHRVHAHYRSPSGRRVGAGLRWRGVPACPCSRAAKPTSKASGEEGAWAAGIGGAIEPSLAVPCAGCGRPGGSAVRRVWGGAAGAGLVVGAGAACWGRGWKVAAGVGGFGFVGYFGGLWRGLILWWGLVGGGLDLGGGWENNHVKQNQDEPRHGETACSILIVQRSKKQSDRKLISMAVGLNLNYRRCGRCK